ncbi:hypothetical protein [Micromonospora sp. NPDC051141]|uniref:hypothetical protein n=1 Tax=Micromonospora sp. NPDC051141 TaxID=3364284 RepID=UPI0037AA917A
MFFLIYTLLLLLGGIAMVAVGVAIKEQGTGSRVLNVIVGLAFFAYGFYLLFLFDGGSYRIFFYVFILPILLIVRAVKARREAREQAAAHQFAGAPQGHPGHPGQPTAPYPGQSGHPGQPAPQPQYGQPVSQGWQPPQPGNSAQPGHPGQQMAQHPGQPGHPTQPTHSGQPGHPGQSGWSGGPIG